MLPGLHHLIESITITPADPTTPMQTVEQLPDGTTTLMWHGLDNRSRLVVAGPHMRARYKVVPRAPSISVRLRPGTASVLFARPIDALANSYLMLDELWGDDALRLTAELAALPTLEAVAHGLERTLHERAGRCAESATARLARRAIRVLRSSSSPRSIDALAASLGVTTRHLRRSFAATVGIGPKAFARIVRLERVLATDGRGDWSTVARAAGYYDQAHMIGEFRSMLGMTPEAYLRRGSTRGAEPAIRA